MQFKNVYVLYPDSMTAGWKHITVMHLELAVKLYFRPRELLFAVSTNNKKKIKYPYFQ